MELLAGLALERRNGIGGKPTAERPPAPLPTKRSLAAAMPPVYRGEQTRTILSKRWIRCDCYTPAASSRKKFQRLPVRYTLGLALPSSDL